MASDEQGAPETATPGGRASQRVSGDAARAGHAEPMAPDAATPVAARLDELMAQASAEAAASTASTLERERELAALLMTSGSMPAMDEVLARARRLAAQYTGQYTGHSGTEAPDRLLDSLLQSTGARAELTETSFGAASAALTALLADADRAALPAVAAAVTAEPTAEVVPEPEPESVPEPELVLEAALPEPAPEPVSDDVPGDVLEAAVLDSVPEAAFDSSIDASERTVTAEASMLAAEPTHAEPEPAIEMAAEPEPEPEPEAPARSMAVDTPTLVPDWSDDEPLAELEYSFDELDPAETLTPGHALEAAALASDHLEEEFTELPTSLLARADVDLVAGIHDASAPLPPIPVKPDSDSSELVYGLDDLEDRSLAHNLPSASDRFEAFGESLSVELDAEALDPDRLMASGLDQLTGDHEPAVPPRAASAPSAALDDEAELDDSDMLVIDDEDGGELELEFDDATDDVHSELTRPPIPPARRSSVPPLPPPLDTIEGEPVQPARSAHGPGHPAQAPYGGHTDEALAEEVPGTDSPDDGEPRKRGLLSRFFKNG